MVPVSQVGQLVGGPLGDVGPVGGHHDLHEGWEQPGSSDRVRGTGERSVDARGRSFDPALRELDQREPGLW